MDNKITIIICVTDLEILEKCKGQINTLNIPPSFRVTVDIITDAASMCEGYNRAMERNDAKYKIYIHQDTLLIHENILYEVTGLFEKNKNLGMIGVVGTIKLPKNGYWWDGPRVGHVIEYRDNKFKHWNPTMDDAPNSPHGFIPVQAVDGLFMATQYDIPWQEGIFTGFHFYDVAQSQEFIRAGFEVGVPTRERPWCIHYDVDHVNWRDFEKYRKKFLDEYGGGLDNEKNN